MKISIIVPVYNSEQFVSQTLDSLLGQTYGNLEVVCVDDGSTDSSRAVLEHYATRDDRICVIAQPNQGVSAARNTGIARSTGDILMFVDADDTLVPHACEYVARVFEEEAPDVLTFGLVCDPPKAAPASLRRELTPANRTYEGFSPDLLFKEYARPYACRSAIRTAFAQREHIGFEPGIALGEDQVFYFAAYPASQKTVLRSEQLYVYRMNDASATHASTDSCERLLGKLNQHLMVIEAIMRIWKERHAEDFCSEELIEWFLDFLMLDIAKLPAAEQRATWQRLISALDNFYTRTPEHYLRRGPAKRCLQDIRAFLAATPSEGPDTAVKPLHMSRYYLMRRGFARCAERVFMRLGLVK